MAGFFEKILEQRGSIDFGKSPEKIIEGRENLKEIFDKLLFDLKDIDNQKNIDKIIDSGAASELMDDIQMSRDILEKTGLLGGSHSNGKEMLRNIETAFTGFLRKAKGKGIEKYTDIIKEKYNELKTVINLIIKCEEFRKKEFGDTSGYLTEEENKKENVNLRLDMHAYLMACKEKFDRRNN